jgi:hypothetical protein
MDVRRGGYSMFKTIGSKMVVRLSALCTGRASPRKMIDKEVLLKDYSTSRPLCG